jgi:tetratricopeptide (TPR) repeat protein
LFTWQAAAVKPDELRFERIGRAEAARIRGDLAGLEVILAELEAALEQPNPDRAGLHYDIAYVLWRCLQNLHDVEEHTSQQQKYPAKARAHVDALLALQPDSVEAKILNGAITGVEADLSLFSRLRIGRVSHTIAKTNAEHAPNNPRTRLQWGIVLLYTPAFFGGGSKPAIEQLEVAYANFKNQRPDRSWPNWGVHETQAWLGMALERDGRSEEARAIYNRVLEHEPRFAWVRNRLLPALDR